MAKKKSPKKYTKTTKPGSPSRRRKSVQYSAPDSTCFVMMPFSDPFNLYYGSIYSPAIKAAGLKPVRADDLFRPSVIVSDLWTMIQESKVLVAELTTKNANVFYELGLAHALGKPIVMVSETMSDVPFDLQQLRVLLYDKNDPEWGDKLKQAVTASIQETLESPVDAVPNIFRKKVESQAPEQNATLSRIDALENQIRRIRLERPLSTGDASASDAPFAELDNVYSDHTLEQWSRRWQEKGTSVSYLRNLAEAHDGIPNDTVVGAILDISKSKR